MMRQAIILAVLTATLLSCSSSQGGVDDSSASKLLMFTGSYASPADEGIALWVFDTDSATATRLGGVRGVNNPSFIVPDVEGNLYAVGEDEGLTSTMNHLRYNASDALSPLRLADSVATGGGAPCFVNISPDGRFVLTANYMGGNITIARRSPGGSLQPEPMVVSFPEADHPTTSDGKPRLHSVNFTPDGRYLLAADLGTDRLHMFPLKSGSDSLIDPDAVTRLPLREGMGPRHIDFSSDGRFGYLLGEVSGEIAVIDLADAAKPEVVQYILADTAGGHGSGDIHLSPDGHFLYASNRLKGDGIAVFGVDSLSGRLSMVDYCLTGPHPRNFAITPDGDWLLVACRDSDAIEVYRRDRSTGRLSELVRTISVSRPTCIRFLPAK